MSARDRSTICNCWQRAQAASPTQLKSGGRESETSAKHPAPQADDCVWQVEHLQSLTALPSSLPHFPDACCNLDMLDFRVERKRLRWYSISRAKWHSNGFGVTRNLPFGLLPQTLSGNCAQNCAWYAGCPGWGQPKLCGCPF